MGCSANADDVRAASLSLSSAQTQEDLIDTFCKVNLLKLNSHKTEVIAPTKGKFREGLLNIGSDIVEVQRKAKCLEVWWRYDLSPGKMVEERVQHARHAFLHWDP